MAYHLRQLAVLTVLLMMMAIKGNLAVDGKVPVLIWSNYKSLVFPKTFAGQTIHMNDFTDLYLNKLLVGNKVNTLAVFVQNKLSVSEISVNADVYVDGQGGALKHTKNLMSEFHSAFLPSVVSPTAALKEFKIRFAGKTYMLKEPFNVVDLKMDSAERNLIFVNLHEERGSSIAVNDYLQHVDEVLNNVTMQLSALSGHFVAVYTGKNLLEPVLSDQRSGRHLLNYKDTENITGLFLDKGGIFMMYTSSIAINYNHQSNKTELSVDPNSWDVQLSPNCPSPDLNETRNNASCTVTLTYLQTIDVEDDKLSNFTLEFGFITSSGSQSGYWYLEKFSTSYQNSSSGNVAIDLDEEFVYWTPFGFSYHCHQNPPILPKKNSSESDSGFSLSLEAFQVQAFDVGSGFGYYNDCVGFFTIPIWSAIICCAVLIAVLFFGIIMLLNIKTMDRLDDPKGKSITVTAAD